MDSADLAVHARQRLEGTVWSRLPGAAAGYRVLLTIAELLARAGITANELTALSLALAVTGSAAIADERYGVAAVLLLAAGVCDGLDGAVARASGHASRAGALYDSVADRIADALPLAAVVLLTAGRPHFVLVPLVAMVAALTVSYVRARAEALGAVLPVLWARRAERLAVFVLTLLAASVPNDPAIGLGILLAGVALLGAFNSLGAVTALIVASRALAEPKPDSETRAHDGTTAGAAGDGVAEPKPDSEPRAHSLSRAVR